MKRSWLFGLVLWAWFPAALANAEFQALSLDNDIPTEIADAAEEGKRLIIMFQEAGCPWCNKMRERIFPHPKVMAYFDDRFILIEQDIKGDLDLVSHVGAEMTQKKYAQTMRVRGTPTIVFFDTDGKIAARMTGYQDVLTFIGTGKYVHDGVFKTGKSLVRWHMEQ
jgi:thioredoxin-related protein